MAINFPDSPANGQVYTIGSKSWTWNALNQAWDATSVTLGPQGIQGLTGTQGISGLLTATAPLSYNPTTQDVSLNVNALGSITALDLTLTGNLTVNGTTTTINSTTISVDDKNIELGSVTTPSNITADGGGITLKGATDKTFNWSNSTSAWTSSEPIIANSFIPSSSTIPTNGMYLPTTNTLSLSTNTTERFRVDANGSVKLFGQILETATVAATAAATTVTYDVITNKNVLYYTGAATANWTFNIRGNASVTLNTLMDTGQSLTVVFLNTNTGTAFYPTALQIDGTGVTPKWQGGSAPTSGNINSIDGYSYTVIKTGSAAYTVLASQTKFT